MGLPYELSNLIYPDIGEGRQPSSRVELDSTDSLAKSLVYCTFPGIGLLDATQNEKGISLSGSVGRGLGVAGDALVIPAGSQSNFGVVVSTSSRLPIGQSADFTIEVLVSMTSASQLGQVFGFGGGLPAQIENGPNRYLLCFGGAQNKNIYFWGANADLASGVNWLEDGSLQHVFVTRSGTSMRFYRGGMDIGGGTTPSGLSTAQRRITVGSSHISGTTPGFKFFKGAIYDQALSPKDILALTNNPSKGFKPPDLGYFVPAAASGSSSTLISASTANAVGSLGTKTTSKVSVSATITNAIGSLATKTTSKVVISTTTANSVGSVATKSTSKVVIAGSTANAVGSVSTKTTSKVGIAATTASSVGSLLSGAGATSAISATTASTVSSVVSKSGASSAISASTANAVGSVGTKTTSKSGVAATTANAAGSVVGYSTSKTTINATLSGVFGAVTSSTGVSCGIGATTAGAVGSLNTKATSKTSISVLLSNALGSLISSSGSIIVEAGPRLFVVAGERRGYDVTIEKRAYNVVIETRQRSVEE